MDYDIIYTGDGRNATDHRSGRPGPVVSGGGWRPTGSRTVVVPPGAIRFSQRSIQGDGGVLISDRFVEFAAIRQDDAAVGVRCCELLARQLAALDRCVARRFVCVLGIVGGGFVTGLCVAGPEHLLRPVRRQCGRCDND